jgi:hypothetical protein
MAGGQSLISWLHPYSTSNVGLNTRTCAHELTLGEGFTERKDPFSESKLPLGEGAESGSGCDIPPLKEPDVLVCSTHPCHTLKLFNSRM